MKKRITFLFVFLIPVIFLSDSCKKDNGGINIFTVDDDVTLGKQLRDTIAADPAHYPLLNELTYFEAYSHVRAVRDSILNTGLVQYGDFFAWEVHIIRNDTVLNAFCTPGGYIYFYTGLIKFLDNDAQFAGVLGHEMAHAALRHSTQQLTKAYGLQILISIVLGQNPSLLAQVAADLAAGLASLAFSRTDEYQADEFSVKYLYSTSYDSRGVAGFFQKMGGASQPPEFLSTHPSPENRIEKIMEVWTSFGGKTGNEYADVYQQFVNSLP
jgi:Zn-dependent protease with chaperone function